jgi:hypothetical protein
MQTGVNGGSELPIFVSRAAKPAASRACTYVIDGHFE